MIKKFIAVCMTGLLLGQNIAFAQTNTPQNLTQYQQRAKLEIASCSWLKKDGLYLLGIAGTAAGLFIFYNKKITSLQNKQNQLANELKAKEDLIQELTAGQKQELEGLQTAYKLQENQVKIEVKEMQEMLEHYIRLVNMPNIPRIAQYTDLFNKEIPLTKRQLLLGEMTQETWYRNLKREEQENLVKLLKFLVEQVGHGPIATKQYFIGQLITHANSKISAFPSMLKNLAHNLIQSKNIFILAAVFTIGWSATADAQGQKRAERLNQNFNLFLEATPEQLAEIEKDPIQRQVCIQGAEALHLLSTLSEQEVAEMVREARTNNIRTLGNQPRVSAH